MNPYKNLSILFKLDNAIIECFDAFLRKDGLNKQNLCGWIR